MENRCGMMFSRGERIRMFYNLVSTVVGRPSTKSLASPLASTDLRRATRTGDRKTDPCPRRVAPR